MNSTTTDDDGVASRPRDSTGAPGREDACVRSLARALDDLASGAFCRRAVQSAGRPIGAMMAGGHVARWRKTVTVRVGKQ